MTGTAVTAIQGIGSIVARRMNEITGAVAGRRRRAGRRHQRNRRKHPAGRIQRKQVSGSVITAQGAASANRHHRDNVLGAAGRLSVEAERLKTEVAGLLAQVRAA